MKKGYHIKGIDKILATVSKEDLARYFEVEQDADFETIITESLKERGVPSGLEIAGYEAINYENIKNSMGGYLEGLSEKYNKDGKGAIGINYPLTEDSITELYFYIDEPIRDEVLGGIVGAKTFLGGVSTINCTMGKKFYEAHRDEISKFQEEYIKGMNDETAFNQYMRDYFDILLGRKGRVKEDDEREYFFDWERERAQKEKERRKNTEQLISILTGGKSIEDVTLQELEQIKQGLETRQEKVREAFAERFAGKEDEQTKE